MAYIVAGDITDSVVNDFGATIVGNKITLSTSALEDLAEQVGVDSTDIETSPVSHVVKQWCVYWVCEMICLDYIGKNNDPVLNEKYHAKWEIFHKLRLETADMINAEVLRGTADEERERVGIGSAIIYRG